MSDRNFGDYTNRNIVKNPLLSTAVTGLSLEDLTHNAVLIPVSLSQEVVTRPDLQFGTQTRSLGDFQNVSSNHPSGDTNSNIITSHQSSASHSTQRTPPQPPQNNKNNEEPLVALPKALVKSEDDFDVNEYFARLHGTRYVSAPLNSSLKEDQNANLEATDENLEEINLNEPEKPTDVPQSLTADIAQNFSQLPTVLPQVASAVFSSFSNMLSLKSRDQTPDDMKNTSGYQDVQFERPGSTVTSMPMMDDFRVKELLPPPKEPPVTGTSNYRLPTKKKYAQIPGFTSNTQPVYNPMTQNVFPQLPPSRSEVQNDDPNKFYMTPDQGAGFSRNIGHFESNNSILNPFSKTKEDNKLVTPPNSPADGSNASIVTLGSGLTNLTSIDMQTGSQVTTLRQGCVLPSQHATEQSLIHGNVIEPLPVQQGSIPQRIIEKSSVRTDIGSSQPPGSSVIPPPPMFSSQTRTDIQPSVGKTVLPPSVARRVTSNHPFVKLQVQPAAYAETLFVPDPVNHDSSETATFAGVIDTSSIKLPSAFASFAPVASQPTVTPTNVSEPSVLKDQDTSNPVSIFTSGTQNESPLPSAFLNETIAPPPMFNPASIQSLSNVPFGLPLYSSGPATSFQTTSIETTNTLPATSLLTGIQQSASLVSKLSGPTTSIPLELSESSHAKPTQSTLFGPVMPSVPPVTKVSKSQAPIAPSPTMFASIVPPPVSSKAPTHPLFNSRNILSNIPVQETPPLFLTPSIPYTEANHFFNPSAIESNTANPEDLSSEQVCNAGPASEPPKHLTEPPKATGNLNYRMTKKRPQYYSGPIEGIGAISNNIKPFIQPIESGAFQGSFFTPHQSAPEIQSTQGEDNTQPFDISRPMQQTTSLAPFDLSQAQNYNEPDYNTAFDLSRPTAEKFEPPKQETKGFGLIGSLKSKLSSIDINKIQSSVTTFFDPAYNSAPKESESIQENTTYIQQQPAYGEYGQTQSNNFEIFVPFPEQSDQQNNQSRYQSLGSCNQYQDYYSNQHKFDSNALQRSYNTPASSVPEFQTGPINYNEENSSADYGYDKIFSQNISLSQSSSTNFHSSLQENIDEQSQEANLTSNQTYTSLSNDEHDQKLPSVTDMQGQLSDMVVKPPHSNIYANFPMESKQNSETISPFPRCLGQFHETCTPVLNDEQELKEDVAVKDMKQVDFDKIFIPNFIQAQPPSSISFFDMPQPLQTKSEEIVPKVPESRHTQDVSHVFEKFSGEDSFVTESKQMDHAKILSSNPCDFFSNFEPLKSKHQGILSFELQSDSVEIKRDQGDVPLELSVDLNPDLTMSSAPLFGLSTMLAIKTKELNDLENDMKNLALHGAPKEIDSIFNRDKNTSFFENIGNSEAQEFKKDEIPDLNICETCREVNRPEDRDEETDDLTTQLIENIVSPIQLSNPVEVPLTESNTPVEDRDDFDRKQCEEISHITEDTIETLQVQSATELLDDQSNNANIRAYGWSIEERTLDVFKHEHDYDMPNPQVPIGFIGNNSLFTNASDEIKAEFYSHDETPVVLSKQMSIPSAPPEEDSKLDDAGLDVHSIEQDAKEDFPIFEEFVIEPLETDDDKIEHKERKSSEDIQEVDSFTSRVEKFKKLEETGQQLEQGHQSAMIDLISTTSPSLPIASYFDTGNYAAETHYQSLYTQMRVPPGFEEEYQRRLSNALDPNKGDIYKDMSRVPDTTTQTAAIFSPTFSMSPFIQDITVASVASKMSESMQESTISTVSIQETPVMTNITSKLNTISAINPPTFGQLSSKVGNISALVKEISEHQQLSELIPIINKRDLITPDTSQVSGARQGNFATTSEMQADIRKLTPFSPAYASENPLREEESNTSKDNKPLAQIIPENSQTHLPDPFNFFSSIIPTDTSEDNSGFNRLASYFSSPDKTEHTKTFFEPSQGQNYYRHESKTPDLKNITDDKVTDPDKIFFGHSQCHNIYKEDPPNIFNISQERYVANLNLMKELTSTQNLEISSEQIVRTINYFTVEYNSELLKSPTEFTHKNEDNNRVYIDRELENVFIDKTELIEYDDNEINDIITECKHCCNIKYGYIERYYNIFREHSITRPIKVKTCMDTGSPPKHTAMDKGSVSSKKSKSVSMVDSFSIEEESKDGVIVDSDKENRSTAEYTPVRHHWFYRIDIEGKSTWRGFSEADSKALEAAFNSPELDDKTLVPTDGGRFDVNIMERLRLAVYWSDKPANVRRCSWFYKGTTDARYVPYTETVAEKLEEEYKRGMSTGEWHRRLVLPNNELVVMHGPAVMVHFLQSSAADAFSGPTMFAFGKRVYRNPPKISVARNIPPKVDHLLLLVHGAGEYRHQKEKTQSMMRPRVVRRGHDESEIEDIEPSSIDHLLLFCHGVGSACDMRFRSVEEVVDDFRSASLQLIQAHYKSSFDNGSVGRVEVLPISWHTTLHSGETGVDRRLDRITLDSIPRLRAFTNDTVLDVLFYTSPVYCQTIINTVCTELNRIYRLFCSRNPDFRGGISLGGHSLGSVILYDLLCNQVPVEPLPKHSNNPPSTASTKSFISGAMNTGLTNILYPKLDFSPVSLYALGSPIAIFECIRGVEMLGPNFKLPTCPNFFNIFHPYDPIAYRIEPLINQELEKVKPLLIPHHKGRKRMHLELKETMARVGADIKQKLIESVKATWTNMWKTQPPPDNQLEKVVEEEMEKERLTDVKDDQQQNEILVTSEMLGKLNGGQRVDYVLQEAPFEMINEYLFAMSSHVCYWDSEDTMLLILRQIYDSLGIQPDSTVPQQNLTVQRTRVIRSGEDVVKEIPSTSRGTS